MGYGGYSLLSRKHTEPFENFTISQLTHTGKVAGAAISPDGKFLLSVFEDSGKQSLWLHNIATNSDTQVNAPADASYSVLSFSPDGNYIYFLKQDEVSGVLNLVRSGPSGRHAPGGCPRHWQRHHLLTRR